MKKLLLLGMALVLTAALVGCGGGDDRRVIAGPGLVGIDDSATATAPLLSVTYTVPPSPVLVIANILSEPGSDGDIEFDPVLNTFFVTRGPSFVLFGEDSLNGNLPEFRAFLTFPLDGSTGQPIVPSAAVIVSTTLEVFVNRVSFASVIPTFLDLVQYQDPLGVLSAADFNSIPLAFRRLDFFSSDQGISVLIDVTPLMQVAQLTPALLDFQVRFLVDTTGTLVLSRSLSTEAVRAVRSTPRTLDNIVSKRGESTTKPLTPTDRATRHR